MRKLTILIAAAAMSLAGCGDDKTDSRDSSGARAPAPAAEKPPAAAPEGGCQDAEAPAPKEDGGQNKPGAKLDPDKRYTLAVDTNCGTFAIELDQDQSPNASASLVALAREKFFDGTVFHRIAPGFVIQGGDPTGSGSGGPGYSTRDKPPADAAYTKGVVAMAKTADEPPGTAGSQFYVVTGEDAGLPPEYAVVGKVTDGQDVVDRIGQLGDGAEQPTRAVVVRSVTVEEG